jgi:protein ImuB
VGFRFERLGDHIERLRPAAPTLDAVLLLDLIRLRLEAVRRLPDGVFEIVLVAEGVSTPREQRSLFAERPRRDPAAIERALARVRAELGDDAVRRARLREGHLPEGSFGWEPLGVLPRAAPRKTEAARLVRRLYLRPVALPPRARREPDGWMLRGLEQGPVVRVRGPYVVSGGWWHRAVHREYHFVETRQGELLWIYYDRMRRRWFLQGRVE